MTRKMFVPSLVLVLAVSSVAASAAQQGEQPGWSSSSKNLHRAPAKVAKAAAGGSSTSEVSVPKEYVVGEADLLHVTVWKEPELSQTVVVRPDGNISLPLVNEIRASGMTPSQIQTLLTQKLNAFLVSPQVTVTVTDIRSKTVYITGEVGKPGAYPLLAPMNVLQLIAKAGGLNLYASRKGIFILRQVDDRQAHYAFDYNKVIRGQNAQQNITLQPGDTVVVP